jgi:D-alanine-D-alanine ligase-like ATP-grasp enzyme/acylphosphatase
VGVDASTGRIASTQLLASVAGTGPRQQGHVSLVVAGTAGDVTWRGIGHATASIAGPGELRRMLHAIAAPLGTRLVHAEVPGDADAVADLSAAVDPVLAAAVPRTWSPRLRAAVEVALLDLAARSRNVSVTAILGGGGGAARASALDLTDCDEAAWPEMLRAPRRPPWVRVPLAAAEPSAVDRLGAALGSPVAGLWLRLPAELPPADASALIGAMASAVRTGGLPRRLLLEAPSTDAAHLEALQATCDRLSSAAGAPAALELRVVGEPPTDPDPGPDPFGGRAIGGVVLVPERLGGPLATLALARAVHAADPDRALLVRPDAAGGDLAARVAAYVAALLPRLDQLASPSHPALVAGDQAADGDVAAPDDHGAVGDGGRRAAAHGIEPPGFGIEPDPISALADFVGFVAHPPLPAPPAPTDVPLRRHAAGSTRGLGKWAVDNHHLARECLAQGLTVERFGRRRFVATAADGAIACAFEMMTGTLNAEVARALARNKSHTRDLLARAGVPVPAGRAFPTPERDAILRCAEEIGYPLVAKPISGSLGVGVSTDIRDRDQLDTAIARIAESRFGSSGVLIERYVTGRDYRLYVAGGVVVSVIERLAGHVVGDGRHTVTELILAKNELRVATNPYLGKRLLKLGPTERDLLRRQDLTLASVPASGQLVRLAAAANVSQGGDSVELLDSTHPAVLERIGRITSAVPGLYHAGIDVVMKDHRRHPDEQTFAVIEINSNAELALHRFPMYGPTRNLARRLVRLHLEAAGLPVRRPLREVTLRLRVQGGVQGVGYRQWFARQAGREGLDGWIANRPDGSVEACVAGSIGPSSLLVSKAAAGPRHARPLAVVAEVVEESVAPDFRIVDVPPNRDDGLPGRGTAA